jgi:broad specificity phosphatase PhoE
LALAKDNCDLILTSDLGRAVVTANYIAEYTKIPLIKYSLLRERSFGVWEKRLFADYIEQQNKLSLEDQFNFCPDEGESLMQVAARCEEVINELLTNYRGKKIIACSHKVFIATFLYVALRRESIEESSYNQKNASINKIYLYGDRSEWRAEALLINNTEHLDPLY